jgi:hypothetical protein
MPTLVPLAKWRSSKNRIRHFDAAYMGYLWVGLIQQDNARDVVEKHRDVEIRLDEQWDRLIEAGGSRPAD